MAQKEEAKRAELPPIGFLGDQIKIGRWKGTIEEAKKFADKIVKTCELAGE